MDLVGFYSVSNNFKKMHTQLLLLNILFTFLFNFLSHLLKAEMKRFGAVDTSVLKQHYEKKVHELELEKKALQVSNMPYLLTLKYS